MSPFFADAGSCAKTIPPSASIARRPRVPSEPMPDRITPMAWLPCTSARVFRKESIGMCAPVALRGTSFSRPEARTMSLEGGMT